MTNVTPPPNRVYPIRPTAPASGNWIRTATVVLGVWLLLSAFLWTHSPGSMTNTWAVGLVIAAIGAIDMVAPGLRWVNAVAALWLLFSVFWLYHATQLTVWNNAIVAIVVFCLSLAPTGSTARANLR